MYKYTKMEILDIYHVLDFEPVKAGGFYVWDKKGEKYLDFYGGHAVISIGHSHPHWVDRIYKQLNNIAFYSNAVIKSIERTYAQKLGEVSAYPEYRFFACNSGAEAVENALKLASFHTGHSKVLAFRNAFHGRTSGAVSVSGYPVNISPFNSNHKVVFADLNNINKVEEELSKGDFAAVIIEGIQGVAGIMEPDADFLKDLRHLCNQYNTVLILDEVQSGSGRTGKYFAHQHAGIKADIVCMAKGMGNGFPVGGIIVSPDISFQKGQLGSTFGGNHLAMAASLAVLEVIEHENLMENAQKTGAYLKKRLKNLPDVKEVRGKGLMLAIEYENEVAELRKNLLFEQKLITGAAGKKTVRLLPPLTVSVHEADIVFNALAKAGVCLQTF